MCTVSVSIPDAVLYDMNMSATEAQAFACRMTALGLYKSGLVSLGYCSQIANMAEADFMLFLGVQGVSIFQFEGIDELAQDVANAAKALEASRG